MLRSAAPRGPKEERTMKVTDVICHLLQSKVDRPFTSARGWTLRHASLLRRRDRDGRWRHRLGRVLRPGRGEQGADRDAVRPARHRPRPLRRRGGVGGPLQPHQGLRRAGLLHHRALRHRHRALGHHGPRHRQAGPQADRRRLPRTRSWPTPPASTSSTWTGWSRRRSRRRWGTRSRASAPSR